MGIDWNNFLSEKSATITAYKLDKWNTSASKFKDPQKLEIVVKCMIMVVLSLITDRTRVYKGGFMER